MGKHRSSKRRRGLSTGLWLGLLAACVVVAVVAGWLWIRSGADSRRSDAASACAEGPATVSVTVDPTFESAANDIAKAYNDEHRSIRDKCVNVHITARPSLQMLAELPKPVWDDSLGAKPALWIPSSTEVANLLDPALRVGVQRPSAYSPIVIAAPTPLADQLRKTNTGWADLPALQANSNSLGEKLGLGGWGGLRLAVPTGAGAEVVLQVGEAVTAAVTNKNPIDAAAVEQPDVRSKLSQLIGTATRRDSSATALQALMSPTPAAGDIHAVPVTAQQVQALHTDLVAAYSPAGPKPVADYPAVRLVGDWISTVDAEAVTDFIDFMHKSDKQQKLSAAGFGTTPPDGALVAASVPTLTAVQTVVNSQPALRRTLILLDTSSAMAQEMPAVTASLAARIQSMPSDSEVGLWTYSYAGDPGKPYRVVVPVAKLTESQRASLVNALNSTRADNSPRDRAYPSLIDAYQAMVSGFHPGVTNSVLLISGGREDQSTVLGNRLVETITSAHASAPVAVDVITFGGRTDSQTLPTISTRTDGQPVRRLTAPTGADFDNAMGAALN